MRTRRSHDQRAAEVALLRLQLLADELAALRVGAEAEDGSVPEPAPGGGGAADDAGEGGTVPLRRPELPASNGGRHARRPLGPTGRMGGWLSDRVPATVRGSFRLGPAQLGVVALLAAAGLVLTAWWLARSSAGGDPVPSVTVTRPSGVPTPGSAGRSVGGLVPGGPAGEPAGPPATVVVDVAGAVRRPGIAVLPAGARVVDALKAAGGARRGVDLSTLNLARVLVDGEQVLVGRSQPGGAAAGALVGGSAGTPGPLVNINTADQATLETLPGIGPVTATAILQWRSEHGSFTSVDELLEVSGIGEATLADLAPYVTL